MTDRDQTAPGAAATPSRRDVLAGGAGFLAAVAGLSMLAPGARAADAPRPHILYILADDLGFADVGFHGSDIRTPNLDRLAAGGAKLSQFYTQPLCTPTRAALMTGRYPMRYGLQVGVIPSGAKYGLATDEFLLPQALKGAGYRTARWANGISAMATRPCGPPARLRQLLWPAGGRDRPFQARGAWRHGLVPEQHPAEGKGLRPPSYSALKPCASSASTTRRHRSSCISPSPRHTRPSRRRSVTSTCMPASPTVAARLCGDDYGHGRADRPGGEGAGSARHARQHADRVPFRQWRHPQPHVRGRRRDQGRSPGQQCPVSEGKGSLYEGGTRVVALANWPAASHRGRRTGPMHVG